MNLHVHIHKDYSQKQFKKIMGQYEEISAQLNEVKTSLTNIREDIGRIGSTLPDGAMSAEQVSALKEKIAGIAGEAKAVDELTPLPTTEDPGTGDTGGDTGGDISGDTGNDAGTENTGDVTSGTGDTEG